MGFIRIDNDIIQEQILNEKELFVYAFLLFKSRGDVDRIDFRIADFIQRMNRDTNTKVKYPSGKAESKVLKLIDKRALVPVLDSLAEKGLVEVEDGLSFSSFSVMDLIYLKVKQPDCSYYEPVSSEFYLDFAHKIGYIGFYLYCFYKKNHNKKKGGAKYTVESIARFTGLDDKSVMVYSYLLQELGIIQITSTKEDNKKRYHKHEEMDCNTYYVPSKYEEDNKYYVKSFSKK